MVHLAPSKKRKIQILKDVSGIVKPSRYLSEMAVDFFSFLFISNMIGKTPRNLADIKQVGKINSKMILVALNLVVSAFPKLNFIYRHFYFKARVVYVVSLYEDK